MPVDIPDWSAGYAALGAPIIRNAAMGNGTVVSQKDVSGYSFVAITMQPIASDAQLFMQWSDSALPTLSPSEQIDVHVGHVARWRLPVFMPLLTLTLNQGGGNTSRVYVLPAADARGHPMTGAGYVLASSSQVIAAGATLTVFLDWYVGQAHLFVRSGGSAYTAVYDSLDYTGAVLATQLNITPAAGADLERDILCPPHVNRLRVTNNSAINQTLSVDVVASAAAQP